uniref:zinc finger domain-containing protein n=1 Tax=Streptomyces virginiae TaxID=1961 RepID=UPI002F91AEF0
MPKKDGSPCGWFTREESCPFHRTTEEQEAERARRETQQEQHRLRVAEDRESHRLGLIGILTVACPHCGVPAAELCRAPKGTRQRTLHQARRKLSGWKEPGSFVLQSYSYRKPGYEPPLDADLAAVLNDPLEDRTADASVRFEREQREADERRVLEARRKLWLVSGHREEQISMAVCSRCGANPGEECQSGGRLMLRSHSERLDAAMAAENVGLDLSCGVSAD